MRNTTLQDLETWFESIAGGERGEEFQGPGFLRPCHFAALAASAHRAGARGLRIPQALEGYAARMHLWQAIGLDPPREIPERNPGGKFYPLTPIESEHGADAAARELRTVFRQCGTDDKTTLDAIYVVLTEILGNCYFHSAAAGGIFGLACAQSWPAANLAQVAVADSGIGIRASLSENPSLHSRLARENATLLATELGVTGKPTGQHSGYGLAVARGLMEEHDGNLLVMSGDEGIRIGGRRQIERRLRARCIGTMVVIEWRTDQPIDVGRVYAKWPAGPGEPDDFF